MSEDKLWDDGSTLKLIQHLYNFTVDHGKRKIETFEWEIWAADLSKEGKKFSTAQLIGKKDRLRNLYSAYLDLKCNTGLGWNNALKTVTCSNEYWKAYVKKNPLAKPLRYGGMLGEDMLDLIFSKSMATGSGQFGVGHPCNPTIEVGDDEVEEDEGNSGGNHDPDLPDKGKAMAGSSLGLRSRVIGKKKKKSSLTDSKRCVNAMELIAASISTDLATQIGQTNRSIDSRTIKQHCQDIIEQMGVDDETYCKSLDAFSANPDWCDYFINMAESRRLYWLMSKLQSLERPPTPYYPRPPYDSPPPT